MLPKQEYLGLLIARTRRQLKQAVSSRIASHGLSPQQFWVLHALSSLPGGSLGELAERQGLDAPTASRIVAGLVRRKLARLDLDPRDRRRSRLALTKAGEALANKLRPVAEGVRAAVVEGLSQREQDALRSSLRRVMENLKAFEERAPAGTPAARKPSAQPLRRKVSP